MTTTTNNVGKVSIGVDHDSYKNPPLSVTERILNTTETLPELQSSTPHRHVSRTLDQ